MFISRQLFGTTNHFPVGHLKNICAIAFDIIILHQQCIIQHDVINRCWIIVEGDNYYVNKKVDINLLGKLSNFQSHIY